MQWDLARTSDSALSVAGGLVRASTGDSVQTLSLMVCDNLGATLEISSSTRKRVEFELIKMQSRPADVIRFLRAAVGYSREDCAAYLARSLARIQFIALPAALGSTMPTYNAAEALAIMLKSTAADKTLLLPVRHLKDLLNALDHLCM